MDKERREYYQRQLKALGGYSDSLLDNWLIWKAGLTAPWTTTLCTVQTLALVAFGYWLGK